MKKHLLNLSLLVVLAVALTGCTTESNSNSTYGADANTPRSSVNNNEPSAINTINNEEPQVKKSSTSICHEKGTTYYGRTQNFTPFNSIEDCLNSGGRLPKK